MNPTLALAQLRQNLGKRRKDPTFRVAPALRLIQEHCPWLGSGARALDIGPRNGIEVDLLRAAGFCVSAIDLWPMATGIRRGDMHALPYADGTFELAFLSHCLEHAKDVDRACEEVVRVLRPGGVVWVAVPRGFPPNPHDPQSFGSLQDVVAPFARAHFGPVETLWAAERAGEIRALLRVAKPAGGLRVMVALPDPLHCRNWVASGLAGMLCGRGHKLLLLVPGSMTGSVKQALPHAGVAAWEPHAGGRMSRWVRNRIKTASMVAREPSSETYRQKLALRRGRGYRLEMGLLRAARGAISALWGPEHALASLERTGAMAEACLPIPRATRLLVRFHPDVATVATFSPSQEAGVIRALREGGVPVLGLPGSFDTLSSKGGFSVRPDRLLVWGADSKAEAVGLHGFPEEAVVVTGPPQFDVYRLVGTNFHRVLDQPCIFVAGTSVHYAADELALVADLDRLAGILGFGVTYKPHPRRGSPPLGSCRGLQRTLLMPWMASEDGLILTRWALEGAEALVTAWSTMVIEAALLGRPSLLVGFGRSTGGSEFDDQPRSGVLEHARWDHIRPILGWPGVRLCRDWNELAGGIADLLAGRWRPDPDRLRRDAGRVARSLDGGARERIIAEIETAGAPRRSEGGRCKREGR